MLEGVKISKRRVGPNKLKDLIQSWGLAYSKIKSNKNFETIKAGCELRFLFEEDVYFMLKASTSEVQAINRLIARRREFFAES